MSFWDKFRKGFEKEYALPQKQGRDDARYEREKNIADSGDASARMKLARDGKTHQEILYYLAENDPDPKIRKAVAENYSTPVQASQTLAMDKDVDVRLALAERLVTLLPALSEEKHSQLYAFAVQAMGALALDEVLKIRLALSSALKDHALTPPKIAGQLARDIEREVSEPILRFCVALCDDDLLDILKAHPESWTVQAIASRSSVSAAVSAAVIDTDDIPAGILLLGNNGAQISEQTLSHIVEKARAIPEWQQPAAKYKRLPPSLARSLASFVDQSVRHILLERTDFPMEDMEEISRIVRRRLDFMDNSTAGETLESKIRTYLKNGQLGDETIIDALSMRETEFVIMALAVMTKTSRVNIEKIIAMKAPKPLIAVAWKAGLSMRTAFQLEKDFAQIPQNELIYPRGGTDYPLDVAELKWQLEFLGIKA